MRKSAKLCLYAVVVSGVVGGTAAWATTDKAIAVSIDGQSRTIHTRSDTVAGALSSARIAVGDHDAVAPAPAAAVHDHSAIVIRRGRLLHLTVDGKAADVWTTATTVDEALSALGYGTGKTVSVSRSTRLPLTATDLTLLTPKLVTIKADGKSRSIVTTVRTVRQAILAAGVALGPQDLVSVKPLSLVRNAQVIVIKRIRKAVRTEVRQIPFSTTSTDDPNVEEGTTTVVAAGKAGLRRITFQYIYLDGKLAGKRQLSAKVAAAPVTRVEKVGTKKPPVVVSAPTTPTNTSTGSGSTGSTGSTGGSTGSTGGGSTGGGGPTPSGDAQSIAKAMVTARGWGGDQFGCLVNLWNRESGWNTHAANPSGAYGIPQALPGSKMASAGPDWQNNATTQISWGLGYIAGRYGNPCGAWAHSESNGWY